MVSPVLPERREHTRPSQVRSGIGTALAGGGCSPGTSGERNRDHRPASPRKPLPAWRKVLPQAAQGHAQACKRRMSLATVPARAMAEATQQPAAQRLVAGLQHGQQKRVGQGGQQQEFLPRLKVATDADSRKPIRFCFRTTSTQSATDAHRQT
jgi:hypothetical protein